MISCQTPTRVDDMDRDFKQGLTALRLLVAVRAFISSRSNTFDLPECLHFKTHVTQLPPHTTPNITDPRPDCIFDPRHIAYTSRPATLLQPLTPSHAL